MLYSIWGEHWFFCVYAFDRVKNIYTFEPDLECFQRLEYHLSENKIKNVYTYNLAIWPYSWKIKYNKKKKSWGITQLALIEIE